MADDGTTLGAETDPDPHALVSVAVSHHDRGVVRAGPVYVKVETQAGRASREREMLSAATEWANIPTPELLWTSEGPPDVLVVSTVPGRPIRADDPPGLWEELGDLLRALHAAPLPDWPAAESTYPLIVPWVESEVEWLASQGIASPSVRAAGSLISEVLSTHRHEHCVIHGDLQTDHVFVAGREIVGIIDWADSILGDPLADVAVVTSRASARITALASGYGPIETEVVRSLWALRLVGEMRWLLDRDMTPEPSILALDGLFDAA